MVFFFEIGLLLWCIYWGWIAFVVYFFGWVDRELAVVAPNVLSHSITVTDTLLRSVTYQHNGHDDDDDDDDDDLYIMVKCMYVCVSVYL